MYIYISSVNKKPTGQLTS